MRFIAVLVSIFYCHFLWSATYYSQSSAAPSITSNWNTDRSGGGVSPSGFSKSNDQFIIQDGHTMTTSTSWSLSSSGMLLQIEDGGVLQANHEIDLTPSSTFTIDNGGFYYHNFIGAQIFDGSESFGVSSTVEFQARPSATFNVLNYGNLIVNIASAGGSLRFNTGTTGTLEVAGDLTIESTGGGTKEVRCATGSATGVVLDVKGDFSLEGGRFNFYSSSGGSGGLIEVGGDFLLTGGTFDNDGTNNLTINLNAAKTESNLEIDGVTEAGDAFSDIDWNVALDNTLTLLSNWEIGAGEVLTVNGQLNFGIFYTEGSGSISVSATGTLGIGASDGIDNNSTAGNIHFTLSNRSIDAGCIIIYNGTSAQETGDGLSDIGTLTGTLQISNTSALVTISDGTDINFGDGFTLSIDENAVFEIGSGELVVKTSGSSSSLTVNGTVNTLSSNGFSASAVGGDESLQGFSSCSFGDHGGVDYSRSSAQSVTNQFSYGHLSLSNLGTKTAAGALDINGDLIVSGTVTFIGGSNQHNIAGNWLVGSSASFTESGSTIVFDTNDTLNIENEGGVETFDDLQFTGSGVSNLNCAIRINSGHTLTIDNGRVNSGDHEFDGPSANLTMSGGTFNLETVTATDQLPDFGGTISLSGGVIELGGTGDQILNGGESYEGLLFSGLGTKTLSSTTANVGSITITESCTLDVENKTFGSASTDLTMDNGYYLIEGSGVKPVADGTYTLTGGTIEFSGSSAQTIRSPKTYYEIVVSGTNVSSSTGDYTLANGGSFTVENGASFTTSSRKITTSGTASVVINGTFTTNDANGFSGTSGSSITNSIGSITLGTSSTIVYARGSGTQNISDRSDYANLVLSGAATKSMSGTPQTIGDFTASGGSVILPSSITFGGSTTQSMPAIDYGNTDIILSGGGDKALSGTTVINGTITFTAGDLDLGNSDLTLESSAVVSSANSSSYIRINGTGRVLQTISSGVGYLFPIGQNPYLPVTVSCASCSNKEISIGVEDDIYEDPTTKTTAMSAAGYVNYVDKTWDLRTNSSIIGDLTIDLQWNNSDQTSDPGANNSSNNMAVGYWEDGISSVWNNAPIAAADVSGNIYNISRTISGLSTNTYYLGVGSNATPLPVSYEYLGLMCNGEGITLKWATSVEINCSHFWVQTSADGYDFQNSLRVEGHGNTQRTAHYNADLHRANSRYIRLAQIDFNGDTHFSIVHTADCEALQMGWEIRNGALYHDDLGTSQFALFDLSGTLVKMEDNSSSTIDLSGLKSGVYILQIGEDRHKVFIP